MKKIFKTPAGLQQLVDEYFDSLEPEIMYDVEGNMIMDKSGAPVMTPRKPATVASLAYAVGLTSKADLLELSEEKRYKTVVARALLRTEAYIERMLFDKSGSTGAKYLLQESFGHVADAAVENDTAGVVFLSDVEE